MEPAPIAGLLTMTAENYSYPKACKCWFAISKDFVKNRNRTLSKGLQLAFQYQQWPLSQPQQCPHQMKYYDPLNFTVQYPLETYP